MNSEIFNRGDFVKLKQGFGDHYKKNDIALFIKYGVIRNDKSHMATAEIFVLTENPHFTYVLIEHIEKIEF